MANFLSRWRPSHLLAAWSAYWVGLAAVSVTPLVLAILRATRASGPPGSAKVSASFGDAGISVTVSQAGQTLLERSAGLLPIALWIGVPPLLLWALWLWARPRPPAAAEPGTFAPGTGRAALGEADPELRSRSRTRLDESRHQRG